MRKFVIRLCTFLLLFLTQGFAQFTNVSGTVTDPNGLAYANGTISATLVLPGGVSPTLNGFAYTPPNQPTGLDSSGSFTLRLADNTVLLPGGTTWNFTVCSAIGTILPAGGKGPICFSLASPITISGAVQSISANLNAAALALGTAPITSAAAVANTWTRVGSVLYPRVDLAFDQQALQEVSVMYDTSNNCLLLSGAPTACWRMWLRCGFTTVNICYAEGQDPYNWQRQGATATGLTANTYSTPIVFKSGSTYYFIGTGSGNNFDLWTSSNGTSWSGRVAAVLSVGSAGQWDSTSLNNPSVVTNGPVAGTWYMLYEGIGTGCVHSCIGSATSTNNGTTWTKSASNPLTNLSAMGGPDLHFLNGQWYAYLHTGTLPSDLWETTSLDFVNWTTPIPVMRRETIDEGGAATFFTSAQIADPFAMEAPCFAFSNNAPGPVALITSSQKCSYLFYEGSQSQTSPTDFHIKLAVANMPLAQAVQRVQSTTPSAGVSPIQGIYDYQVGHIFGLAPFYWMQRISTNTDLEGELAFSAATTATYTWQGLYSVHPECELTPQFDFGATRMWVTYSTTVSFTINFSGAVTGNVSYHCDGRN